VTDTGASDSGSGTKISAALFLYLARCRSTQLYEALILPPTNHFQNGGSLVSSVVCQYLSQLSRSAYSRKHSGKFFSLKRSLMSGSVRFAWPTNFAEG
jgi:hypothetical protein